MPVLPRKSNNTHDRRWKDESEHKERLVNSTGLEFGEPCSVAQKGDCDYNRVLKTSKQWTRAFWMFSPQRNGICEVTNVLASPIRSLNNTHGYHSSIHYPVNVSNCMLIKKQIKNACEFNRFCTRVFQLSSILLSVCVLATGEAHLFWL